MSLLPPTLEELPPQRGAFLELHSLNKAELNGTIAEFLRVEPKNGRYVVLIGSSRNISSSNNNNETKKKASQIGVQPKNCRRPPLQPLHVRKQMVDTYDGATITLDDKEKLQQALKVDLCFPAAHWLLAEAKYFEDGCENRKSGSIAHYRRAVANQYAYEELLDPLEVLRPHMQLANALLLDTEELDEVEEICRFVLSRHATHVQAHFCLAKCLWHVICGGQDDEVLDKNKALQLGEPAEHFLKALDGFATKDPSIDYIPSLQMSIKVQCTFMRESSKVKVRDYILHLQGLCSFGAGHTIDASETALQRTACRRTIEIADRFIQVCSEQNNMRPLSWKLHNAVLRAKGSALGHLSLMDVGDVANNSIVVDTYSWEQMEMCFQLAMTSIDRQSSDPWENDPLEVDSIRGALMYEYGALWEARGDAMSSAGSLKAESSVIYRKALASMEESLQYSSVPYTEGCIRRIKRKLL